MDRRGRDVRIDGHFLVVAVSDVKSFAVDDFEVLAGPVMICWVILDSFWERGLRSSVYSYPYSRVSVLGACR